LEGKNNSQNIMMMVKVEFTNTTWWLRIIMGQVLRYQNKITFQWSKGWQRDGSKK